jgi:hypothetical protein
VPGFDFEMQLHGTRKKIRIRVADDDVPISLLSVAVPHCGRVIIDEFWANAVTTKRLDKKYSTVLRHDASAADAYMLCRGSGRRAPTMFITGPDEESRRVRRVLASRE